VLRSQTDERMVALGRATATTRRSSRSRTGTPELIAHCAPRRACGSREDIVQQAMLSAWSALTRRADVLDVAPGFTGSSTNAALRVAQHGHQHEELRRCRSGGIENGHEWSSFASTPVMR